MGLTARQGAPARLRVRGVLPELRGGPARWVTLCPPLSQGTTERFGGRAQLPSRAVPLDGGSRRVPALQERRGDCGLHTCVPAAPLAGITSTYWG